MAKDRWEYKIRELNKDIDIRDVELELTLYGKDGWELAQVIDNQTWNTFIFKRLFIG